MPDHKARFRRRISVLRSTENERYFDRMLHWHKDRGAIICEGDSWFGYPPNMYVAGKSSNIIDFIESDYERYNILRLESNGHEAVQMLEGKQRKTINSLLKDYGDLIDVFMFSGGGNDIVGEDDMPRYLKSYEDGMKAKDCINLVNFEHTLSKIRSAYIDLIRIRDDNQAKCVIVTHTYEIPTPSDVGGRFFGGLVKTDSWVKPSMDANGIRDPQLQKEVIEIMMLKFKNMLFALQERSDNFIVVDTQGTLDPEDSNLWLNEIHPSHDGFKIIADKMMDAMKDFL